MTTLTARTGALVLTLVTMFAGPAVAQAPHGSAPGAQQSHGQKPDGGLGHMDHAFDDPARYAKEFDDPARDAWQMPARVIEALALKPGDKVADIGAGTGYFAMRLAASGAQPAVFAVDLEPKMVAHLTARAAAEKRANVVAVQASATSPNLPEPMDVVLVVDTYHHIANRPVYFAGVREKLRPGGRLAIVDFRKGAAGGGPADEFRFTPDQISGELTAAGFVLDAQHGFLPRQNFLVYRVAAPAQAALMPVTLRFALTAGGTPVGCGAPIAQVGTTKSTVNIIDARLYLSRLRLVRADGTDTPITLTQDGLWQVDDVALLDFENATGACANGSEQTRDVVEGTVPAGTYTGVRFEVGLPFEKNHRDPTLQPSPLNLSRMFWNWNGGYKFMRFDLKSTGQPRGWLVHLGSTACTPAGSPSTVPVSCANRNAVTVDLPAFSAARDVVELDFLSLFATSNVDMNTDKTAMGCMSGGTDPECAGLFGQLGLPVGGAAAAPQKVFRAKSAATMAR